MHRECMRMNFGDEKQKWQGMGLRRVVNENTHKATDTQPEPDTQLLGQFSWAAASQTDTRSGKKYTQMLCYMCCALLSFVWMEQIHTTMRFQQQMKVLQNTFNIVMCKYGSRLASLALGVRARWCLSHSLIPKWNERRQSKAMTIATHLFQIILSRIIRNCRGFWMDFCVWTDFIWPDSQATN